MAWPTATIDTTSMDADTDSPVTARPQIKQMADNVNDIKNSRGATSGIASLGSTGLVPLAQLGTGTATAGFALVSQGPTSDPAWQGIASFDAGTRMAFQQTAAPTGWTKDTTAAINDSILRLVTGSASSGGSTAFSTWSGQTTTGATTLAESQIPSHTHGIAVSSAVFQNGTTARNVPSNSTAATSAATGGGGSHTHSLSQAIKYYDFIIASKN